MQRKGESREMAQPRQSLAEQLQEKAKKNEEQGFDPEQAYLEHFHAHWEENIRPSQQEEHDELVRFFRKLDDRYPQQREQKQQIKKEMEALARSVLKVEKGPWKGFFIMVAKREEQWEIKISPPQVKKEATGAELKEMPILKGLLKNPHLLTHMHLSSYPFSSREKAQKQALREMANMHEELEKIVEKSENLDEWNVR